MEINERVKVESKTVVILSYVQALDWCVRTIDDWEASWLAAQNPMGWEWIEGLGSKWLVPSCGRVTGGINEAEWLNGMKMAVTAEEKAALLDFGEPSEDMVNNPPHYQIMEGVEVIDVRKGLMDKIPSNVPFSQVDDWSRSWEYITRMWGKNGLEDAKKARFYLNRLINAMEGDR